jgi:hypothetical protein
MINLKDILNETASKEAMGIAGFTGTRGIAVQKFIDDFNLNAKKLFNFIAKGKLKDRMEFAAAISGTRGNKYQGNFVGMFGEGAVNETSPCWKGYKQVGMKDKGGRQVPNCVPNESIVKEDIPTKEVSPAEKAKNINNRIKVLRAQIGAQKDPVKRAKIQSTLRNAMQTLSKNRGGSNK